MTDEPLREALEHVRKFANRIYDQREWSESDLLEIIHAADDALTATPREPSQEWAGLQPAWHGGEPAPAPLDVEPPADWPDWAKRAVRDANKQERSRLTARAAAADHEGFSPTPPGNTHWKRTPLARAAATENE